MHDPRWIGSAIALALTVGTISAGAASLQDEALTVINELPDGARKMAAVLDRRREEPPSAIDSVKKAAEELQKTDAAKPPPGVMRVQVEDNPFQLSDLLWTGSLGAISAINQIVMILFLTYFMLVSDKLMRRKFVELAGPTLTRKRVTIEIIDDISAQIGRFLLVLVFTSLVVGIVTWMALQFIGLEQAALWGLLAGIFNSIPYYGPLIVSGGLAAVAFLQFGTLGMVLLVASVALLITSLEGWLVTPLLMGKVGAMNRVVVFVGLLFWSWVWDIWGLLLAVPLMMAIKVICDHVEDLQPIGRFLGE
jgi:predicted PurR-regulated permease PerM